MAKKLRVGIFGIGHNHAAAAIETLRARDDVEILGLCEDNKTVLEKRLKENPKAYGGVPVMGKEELFALAPEAAMVETEVPYLVPTALECAEAGMHVHMDKPAGTDLAAYRKLLSVLEEKSLVFQTGYMYRYNAGINYLLQRAKSGALGKIYNITAQMSTKHPAWFRKQLLSYGVKAPVMFIFGGHLLDLCLQLKGAPEEIKSWHTRSRNDGIDLEDTSLSVLRYADGLACVRVSSVEVNGWGMREFTVYGEKGTVSVRPMESPMTVRETLLQESEAWKDRYREIAIPEEGRYDRMMEEFVDMIRGDIPYKIDFRHEYELQKYTLLACGYGIEE